MPIIKYSKVQHQMNSENFKADGDKRTGIREETLGKKKFQVKVSREF